MDYARTQMSTFPNANNPTEKYDVVFIGNIMPNYCDSHIASLFNNDYVFLFTTRLNQDKDSYWYGHAKIDLVRHDHLSYFNPLLRERGSFHVLEKEPLRLNDFLEVIPEETENGIQIIAHLKKQKILGKDYRTIEMVRDFRVLLLRENNGEHYDNYPILELGPEFQADIDLAEAKLRYYNLCDTSFSLKFIGLRSEGNPEMISAIEVVQAALNQDIADAKLIKEQKFERYLDYKKNLSYAH